MDYKISKRAYDVYAPVTLTNEIPPLNITGIRNRQLQLDWANDLIGFTKINYVEKTSTKIMDGVKSVNYKPEHLKFYDLDSDQIIEGFLDKIDFEIGGNFVIECDYLMHEFHKYLFRLYPEHQNTLITLTKNERQGYFNEVGSMIHSHWDSSRLLYNDEDELLYLQHKLYTKLNAVRQNTGTAKNYEDLMRLLGISWVYSGFKLFTSNTGIGIPSLKEDDKMLDLTTDLIFLDTQTALIGDTLRVLQGNDLQSPFRATYSTPIVDNIDAFKEFQIAPNPMDFEETMNYIYKFGVPYENWNSFGLVSPEVTLEELSGNPIVANVKLYDENVEFQRLIKSTDGWGVLPFRMAAGNPQFEREVRNGDEYTEERIDNIKAYTNTYLRSRSTIGTASKGEGAVIKTGELIWDENFLNYFADFSSKELKKLYQNDTHFKERIDGVYRIIRNEDVQYTTAITVALYDRRQRLIIKGLLKDEYSTEFKTALLRGEDFDHRKLFQAVSYPEETNVLIYSDDVYYFGYTIHVLHKIDATLPDTEKPWNFAEAENPALLRNVKLITSKVLTHDPEWMLIHDPQWAQEYGVETLYSYNLEQYCQNTVSVRVDAICGMKDCIDNVSAKPELIVHEGAEHAVKVITANDITMAFSDPVDPDDYKYIFFGSLNIEHQVINKIDVEVLPNSLLKTKFFGIKEILDIKGQLHFGLLLQGKRYYGFINEYYIENDNIFLKMYNIEPAIDKDTIYNPEAQLFYVNDMIEEGEYNKETAGRRGYRITPCIYKGSVYYKCFWDPLTKEHLNYYLSNIFSDKGLYTKDFLDIFKSNNTEATNAVVDSGELVIYDSKMNQDVIKEFIEENKSVYRNVSLLKIVHIPLVLHTVIRNDDYGVTTAAYSNNIPTSGAFYNVDLKDLPKLTDFLGKISDKDYTDIKIISDITGARMVTWGNAIWDSTDNRSLQRFRAIWSGYFTSFEVTLTTSLFPDETELENLIDTNEEYEQSFTLSPYNIDNYTKDNMGKWDVAFVIPDEGSTAIKNAKLYNYTCIKPEVQAPVEVSARNSNSSIQKGDFHLTLNGLTVKYKSGDDVCVRIDRTGNNLIYTNGLGTDEEVNYRLYSFDNILHLEGYSNKSYFNYSNHPEIAEIINKWFDKKYEEDPAGRCSLTELLDRTISKENDTLPAVAIIENISPNKAKGGEQWVVGIYVIDSVGYDEITISKHYLELSNVPVSLLFNIGHTDANNNVINEIQCEGKRAAKEINKLISATSTLISYPYFITQKSLQFIQENDTSSESDPKWKVDDSRPAKPILGRAAFTYNTFITTSETADLDYNLTDNFLYFKEFIKVQLKTSVRESFKQFPDYVLNLKNDTKLLDIEKNDFLLLKDINVPIKRASYTGNNEIFVIDRNVNAKELNIVATKGNKILFRDTYFNNKLTSFDKEVGLDSIRHSNYSSLEENSETPNAEAFQIKNPNVSIKQYWNTTDKSIDYTYYKRKFVTKAVIDANNSKEVILKDPGIDLSKHITRGDNIDILISSGIKLMVGDKEVTSFVDYEDQANYYLLGQVRTKEGLLKYFLEINQDDRGNQNNKIKTLSITNTESTISEVPEDNITASGGAWNINEVYYVFQNNGNTYLFTENLTWEIQNAFKGGNESGITPNGISLVRVNRDFENKTQIYKSENYELNKIREVVNGAPLPLGECTTKEYILGVETTEEDNPVDIYTVRYDTNNIAFGKYLSDVVDLMVVEMEGGTSITFSKVDNSDEASMRANKLTNDPIFAYIFGYYDWETSKYGTYDGSGNFVPSETDSVTVAESELRAKIQDMSNKIRVPTVRERTVIKDGENVKVTFLDFDNGRKYDEETAKKFLSAYYARKISTREATEKITLQNDDYFIAFDPTCLGITIKNIKEDSAVSRVSLIQYASEAFNMESGNGKAYLFNDTLRSKGEDEKTGSFYYNLYQNNKDNPAADHPDDMANIAYTLVKANPSTFFEGVTDVNVAWSKMELLIKECAAAEYLSPSYLLKLEMQLPGGGLRNAPITITNKFATTYYQRILVQDFVNTADQATRITNRFSSRRDTEPWAKDNSVETKDKVYKIKVADALVPNFSEEETNVEGSLHKEVLEVYKVKGPNNFKEYQNKDADFESETLAAIKQDTIKQREGLVKDCDALLEIIGFGEKNVDDAIKDFREFIAANKEDETMNYFQASDLSDPDIDKWQKAVSQRPGHDANAR